MAKTMYAILMWVVRLTWGILDSLIGFFIFLFFVITRKPKIGMKANCIVVEVPHKQGEPGWGLEGGIFIFSNTDGIWNDDYLLHHEWGHCWPQMLVFGPLHPFVVGLPSVIRFWWRELQSRKGRTDLPTYDSIWFEGTATRWGTKWFKWGVEHGLWS